MIKDLTSQLGRESRIRVRLYYYFDPNVHHTVLKSRDMNRTKQVSNFLIFGTNNVVEHYGKNETLPF